MKLSGCLFIFFYFFIFLACACAALTILTGTVIHIYTVYRYPLRHLKDGHEVISILRSLLTNNPPTPPMKGWPHHRCLRLLLFSISGGVGSFTSDN